jgi:Tfp pilus assembly protein PilV
MNKVCVLPVVASIAIFGCSTQMGYPQPVAWTNYPLPPTMKPPSTSQPKASSVLAIAIESDRTQAAALSNRAPLAAQPGAAPFSAPMVEATQYQIGVCEEIAGAYGKRAQRRSTTGFLFSGLGLAAAGGGTALAAGSATLDDPKSTAGRAMVISGVALTAAGVIFTIVNNTEGAARSTNYSDAGKQVLTSLDAFRSSMRSAKKDDSLLSEDGLREQLCALRKSCKRRQVGTDPVGDGVELLTASNDDEKLKKCHWDVRAHLVGGYLDELCNDYPYDDQNKKEWPCRDELSSLQQKGSAEFSAVENGRCLAHLRKPPSQALCGGK